MSPSIPAHPGLTPGIKPVLPTQAQRTARWLMVGMLAWLCICTSACQEPATAYEDEVLGMPMSGIDHLPDHLSVQDYSVNGRDGAQAGKGGSTDCCVDLPRQWRPGMTVVVRWNVTNWRDCRGDDYVRTVSVEHYARLGQVWVHFLTDGSVRVITSEEDPYSPTYPGPHDPIPQKHPWDTLGWSPHCDKVPNTDKPQVKESLP